MPPAAPRILVIEHDPLMAGRLQRLLAAEGYAPVLATTGEEGFRIATQLHPEMAIVDVRLPDTDGYALCRRFREEAATMSLPVLLLRRDRNAASKIAVIEAGANDHITQPFYPDALIYRVKSALVRAEATPDTLIGVRGKTIALFGCKGGVGTTTIAVNLAVALHQRSQIQCALLDADFSFGDVGVQLDLPRQHTILDLVRNIEDLDPLYVEQVLGDFRGMVRVLLGPPLPEHAELISAEHVTRFMETLRQQFSYTVVDCATSYDERILAVLEHADHLLLICTPEVSAIRNTSTFLDLLRRLKLPQEKVRIVLNRANSNQQIGVREIERHLRHDISFFTPSSGQMVVRSLTQGVPLVLEQPSHAFCAQIFRMADTLLHEGQPPQSMALLPAETSALRTAPVVPQALPAPTPERPAERTAGSGLFHKLLRRIGSA